MIDLETLYRELEFAKKAVAAFPNWKLEMIRRAHDAEVSLGYIAVCPACEKGAPNDE